MADASPNEQPVAADSRAADAPAAMVTTGKRKRLLTILAVVVVVAASVWGIWYFLTQAGRVETENAYVGADTAAVTALISGPVLDVRVGGTQAVKKGDILVVLDPADAKVDVATAEAALFQARQRYGQTAAQVGSARAKLLSRDADIAQARARVTQANAQLERARVELSRRKALAGSGAVSGEELTAAQAGFDEARAALQLANAGVVSAQATSSAAESDVAANESLIRGTTIGTSPDVASAQARVDAAKLALSRTVLRAPIDGVVTNRNVQIGQRIAAGATIMTIVPTTNAYVDANFKESQFRHIRFGQSVELTSDFYGGSVVYHGKVFGFAGRDGRRILADPGPECDGQLGQGRPALAGPDRARPG